MMIMKRGHLLILIRLFGQNLKGTLNFIKKLIRENN